MESDQGKLFIGGISWETTEEKLKVYFSNFGEVVEAVIMKDRATGRARGFGFIVFADPSVADMVVLEKHSIDGRMVEAKKAVPRDEQQIVNRNSNGGVGNSSLTPSNPSRTKKIFVGGLASTVTENDFKRYFGLFGTITDVVVMYDHGTQRPRGFGFITYDSEDSVDRVLQKTFHELNDKMVEVKRAVPKDLSAGPSRNNGLGLGAVAGSRGSPCAVNYAHVFNSSPIMSYVSQIDRGYGSSRSSRGLFPPYGAVGHGNSRIHNGSVNGAYSSGIYGGNASYGGGGYGSGMHGGSSIGGSYGNASNSRSFSNAYGSSPGRNPWGSGGASYDNVSGSVGFVGSQVPTLSSYGGMGKWATSQTPSKRSVPYDNHSYVNAGADGAFLGSISTGYGGQSIGYDNHSYVNEGADGAFLGSNSTGYGGQSSLGALGVSRSCSGSAIFSGDIYGSSGFSDSTWRATPADKFRSANAGFGGLGHGFYGLHRSTNSNGEDIQAVDDGYGNTERQSFTGVPV